MVESESASSTSERLPPPLPLADRVDEVEDEGVASAVALLLLVVYE